MFAEKFLEQTPARNKLKSLAARALRLSKEQEPDSTRRTRSRLANFALKKIESRSRSPTPFDNVSGSKTMEKPKPDLSKLFDVHHNRNELIRSFPFGPVQGIRYSQIQAGRDPTSTPAITPDMDGSREFVDKTPDETKNGTSKTAKFFTGQSKEQRMRPIAMEPHNRTLMRRVVSNLKTNKAKKRWQMVLDKQDDTTEEYVINYCKVQETEIDVKNLAGAGKLW